MNLRIKYIAGVGYFAQVKHGFFSLWKTIGKHSSGYGLYPEDCIDHPEPTDLAANEKARLYEQWFVRKDNHATYRRV